MVLAALGFRARRRRGYAPLFLGLVAVSLLLVGKFVLEFAIATYGGLTLLIVASVWNSWPKRLVNSGVVQIALGEDAHRNQ